MIILSNSNKLLEIETKYPLIGVTFLVCFLEGKHKENLSKQFKFSYDNIVWSNYLELSRDNINTVEIINKHKLFLQFSFVTDENIEDGLSLQLDDNFYQSTIFSQYFKSFSLRTMQWVENILEKFLIKSGNLANFIDRQNDPAFEDFIVFWFSILKYFSYYGSLADIFSRFSEISVLLIEYLSQRDLILQGNESLDNLQLFEKTFYYQMVKRGTMNIVEESDSQLSKGEFLRLIKKENTDEFIFDVHRNQDEGWNLGNNSPLYRGLRTHRNINKIKDDNSPIIVDYRMNYSCFFKLDVTGTCTIKIDVQAFDKDMTSIPLVSHKTGTATNSVITTVTLIRDTYIDFHIYNTEKPIFANDILSIRVGNNLKLVDEVKYIKPIITILSGTGEIQDIRLVPMFTDYTRGFLMTKTVSAICANNSNLTKNEIVNFTDNKLLPYDRHLLFTNIGDYIYTDSHETPPHYEPDYDYLGGEPSCTFEQDDAGVFTEQFTPPFI